jgi:hypothetical protein
MAGRNWDRVSRVVNSMSRTRRFKGRVALACLSWLVLPALALQVVLIGVRRGSEWLEDYLIEALFAPVKWTLDWAQGGSSADFHRKARRAMNRARFLDDKKRSDA